MEEHQASNKDETSLADNPVADGPSVQHFVTRYLSITKKSAETIVELSATLYEAETELNSPNFQQFCDEVKIEKGKSHHKKLRTIGKHHERLNRVVDRLPSCWTTIYKLAKLPSEDFQALVDDDVLSAHMKAKDIDEHLESPSKKRRGSSVGHPLKIIIIYSSVGPTEQAEIMKTLKLWRDQWALEIKSNYGAFDGKESETGEE